MKSHRIVGRTPHDTSQIPRSCTSYERSSIMTETVRFHSATPHHAKASVEADLIADDSIYKDSKPPERLYPYPKPSSLIIYHGIWTILAG
ncbi:hypothetical protein HPB48_002571 [Haemaphysalis longicornis]|uniref:Uncharacterized protein n=1 Tax=Haemaphysalis longicornis TaxID=44386 RepID=A0A9J6FAJ0_HAELO|nr:hypothetical protein HPB48_002571 [Haemaphysalis longicornis]